MAERAVRYGNGIACWIFGIRKLVTFTFVKTAEIQTIPFPFSDKCLNVLTVKHQLGKRLTPLAAFRQGVQHDV